MAFGSTSSVFTQFMINPGLGKISGATNPTGFGSLTADALLVALFGNTGTPNKDDTLANSAYSVGQWVTGNEVTDATNWVAGGRALGSPAFSNGAGFVQFAGANTSGAGNVTIANAYGSLLYDSTITAGTVAKQGICFSAFGGANSVTAGTFTIQWNANGIIRWNT